MIARSPPGRARLLPSRELPARREPRPPGGLRAPGLSPGRQSDREPILAAGGDRKLDRRRVMVAIVGWDKVPMVRRIGRRPGRRRWCYDDDLVRPGHGPVMGFAVQKCRQAKLPGRVGFPPGGDAGRCRRRRRRARSPPRPTACRRGLTTPSTGYVGIDPEPQPAAIRIAKTERHFARGTNPLFPRRRWGPNRGRLWVRRRAAITGFAAS